MDTHAAHLIQRGKKLSYLLRHDKSYTFDEHGWREVSDLVANHGFTMKAKASKWMWSWMKLLRQTYCIMARQKHPWNPS